MGDMSGAENASELVTRFVGVVRSKPVSEVVPSPEVGLALYIAGVNMLGNDVGGAGGGDGRRLTMPRALFRFLMCLTGGLRFVLARLR
jgi:hypothetical protein